MYTFGIFLLKRRINKNQKLSKGDLEGYINGGYGYVRMIKKIFFPSFAYLCFLIFSNEQILLCSKNNNRKVNLN